VFLGKNSVFNALAVWIHRKHFVLRHLESKNLKTDNLCRYIGCDPVHRSGLSHGRQVSGDAGDVPDPYSNLLPTPSPCPKNKWLVFHGVTGWPALYLKQAKGLLKDARK
jgi:hypothetical protein